MSAVPTRLALLGRALDLVVERDGRRWRLSWKAPAHVVCCDGARRRLFIVPEPQKGSGRAPRARTRAAAAYELFQGFAQDADLRRTVRLEAPRVRGRAVSIGYRRRKWHGKPVSYEHKFDGRPRVTQLGDVYRIAGGTLRVTARGIEG